MLNWLYLIVLFLTEFASIFALNTIENITIFISVSFFMHFAFLTHFYLSKIYLLNNKLKTGVISLGVVLLLLNIIGTQNQYHFYGRFIFSVVITLYSLIFIYQFLKERITYKKELFIFNSSILLFFCIDAFLAIASDYLINNSLVIVSWFWFFRAVLLQLFYISLIYYLWKTGKTTQPQ
jgi:hypothetical protein